MTGWCRFPDMGPPLYLHVGVGCKKWKPLDISGTSILSNAGVNWLHSHFDIDWAFM